MEFKFDIENLPEPAVLVKNAQRIGLDLTTKSRGKQNPAINHHQT